MKHTVCLLALLLVLAAAWPQRAARGEEGATWVPTADEVQRAATRQACYARERPRPPRRRTWQFEAAVPVWVPGVSGSFGKGGVTVDPDGSIGDVAGDVFDVQTDLDFAFVGAFAARRGPWTFAVDAFGARLGNNIDFVLTDGTLVDAKLGAFIASARVGYRVWTKPFRLLSRRSCLKVDAYAGARWYYADFEVKLPVGPQLDASEGWFDPIVGLDAELRFGRRLALHVRGDVGGFGMGSDLAWWFTAGLEYRFSRLFSLAAGWAVMDADFTSGSGDDEFTWNLTLSGPQLVAGFRF